MRFTQKSNNGVNIGNKTVAEVITEINNLCLKLDVPYTASEYSEFVIDTDSTGHDFKVIARDLSLSSIAEAKQLFENSRLNAVWVDDMLAGFVLDNKFVLAFNPAY